MQVNGKKRKFNKWQESSKDITNNGYIFEPTMKSRKEDFCEQFSHFCVEICTEKELLRKSLKKLLEFIQENQDNNFRDQIGPMCNVKFMVGLLWRYNCKLSGEDLLIYDILEHLEKYVCLDYRIVSPLVFGEHAKNYFNEMITFGRRLHRHLTSDQVLEYFDQKLMWNTLVKMTTFDKTARSFREFDPNCYDPRFVLRILVQLVAPGTRLSCKNMVTSNALSFCLASTSFYDPNLRAFAYTFLERFRRRLLELSDEHFPQRVIYRHILDQFKGSLEYLNQRVNHLVSQFLARTVKVALTPEEPLYSPLMAFLSQRPFLQLDTVPEFLKLFFSSSTEFCQRERQWMLRLISNSIVDPADYGALSRVYAIESFLALWGTPMADYWSKLLLMRIFRSCLELKSAQRDLFLRLDFASWLASAIAHKRTTVMEQLELGAIFRTLASRVEPLCSGEAGEEGQAEEDLASSEARRPFLRVKLRLNAQKILAHLSTDLRIVADKDMAKRDKLVGWLRTEFQSP